jgi:hypothetical protein
MQIMYTTPSAPSGEDYYTRKQRRSQQPSMPSMPYGSYRRSSGPNGVTETETMPLNPSAPAPFMNAGVNAQPTVNNSPAPYSGDALLRRQNMGLSPRGPSPNAFPSPKPVAPNMTAGMDQNAPVTPQFRLGSVERGRAHKELMDLKNNPPEQGPGTPEYTEWQGHIKDLNGRLYGATPAPTTQPSTPSAPAQAGGSAPYSGRPAPTTQPGETSPGAPLPQSESYVRRGPNLAPEAPLDPSERQRRVRDMYATAAADLDKNPGLGTQPLQAPRTQFTYGAEAARRAVEMGPGQQGRNEAAMRRGEQRRVNTVNDASAAQFAQNQQASQNIGLRSQQFDQGDYSFSKPLPAVGADGLAQAPASTQQQPQTAGAQQRVPQGGQQQLTNFHVNPQTGERIGWNGTSWQKAQ